MSSDGGLFSSVLLRVRSPQPTKFVFLCIYPAATSWGATRRQPSISPRKRELRRGIRHPNLVAVYETGEVADEPFIVSEPVDGRLLSSLLSEMGADDLRPRSSRLPTRSGSLPRRWRMPTKKESFIATLSPTKFSLINWGPRASQISGSPAASQRIRR